MKAVVPSLNTVQAIQQNLFTAGVPTVVGGSALLVSLGAEEVVNDWDLITDSTPNVVEHAVKRLGPPFRLLPPTLMFASRAAFEFDAEDHTIDLIVGFAINSANGPTHIPAIPGSVWNNLTMARPEEWALAYELMGRKIKADTLRLKAEAPDPG